MNAFVTDYIQNPDIEKEILGTHYAEQEGRGCTVFLAWNDEIDAAWLDRFPGLKAIIRYGAGYDKIDTSEAARRGIIVCNTPDYGTDEVSDTALAMVLNISRGISSYNLAARGYHDTWQLNTDKRIRRHSELKLGIIGAGRIGGSLILKANACKLRTLFYDPYKPRGHEKMLNCRRVDSQGELLAEADILSVNCPLTDETRGMVNENFIARMKAGASLVNTARGGILVDIDVLYGPMKSGHIAHAGLDVLPDEPPKPSKLIDAWRAGEGWLAGRLMINPHTAYYSQEAYIEMRRKAALNALRVINGERPFNIVNGL
jgi:D-3-phosphoglycerate dehydrogenase